MSHGQITGYRGQLRRNRRYEHALTFIPPIFLFYVIRKSDDLRAMPRDWHRECQLERRIREAGPKRTYNETRGGLQIGRP